VTPLAEAAAAAFPRLDLTADEAGRLAHGARLPLPPHPPAGPAGPAGPKAAETNDWPHPGDPVAAFDPDGALVALVTADSGRLRSLAVFTA
jgi:tRNA pseudouridine55 synthase